MSLSAPEPGPASYAADKAAIWKEIHALWRVLRQVPVPTLPTETIFSFAGAPVVSQVSPPYQARLSAHINRVMVGLGTAGSSPSEVTAYLNGNELAVVTVEAGEQRSLAVVDEDMDEGDFVTTVVTKLGSGATDFTVQVHWR